jgi:hypothetical protein
MACDPSSAEIHVWPAPVFVEFGPFLRHLNYPFGRQHPGDSITDQAER